MGRPDKDTVRVDKALLAKLAAFAEKAGEEIPELAQFQPKIDLDVPVIDLAKQLGSLCMNQPIFRQADSLVAVDDEGVMRPMTSERFGSWVEKFVTTTKWTKDRGEHASTIPKDLAAKIMAADGFRVLIRPLMHYFPVRLPVERPSGDVELLEPGYDPQTQSWTEDGVPYDDDWDLDRANDWREEILGEWPYADQAGRHVRNLAESRDAAVILGAMVGNYMRTLTGLKRPMVAASGNQPGTGKTTLVKMTIAPVYGLPPEMSLPPTEEKFERLLESVALGMRPVLFLDDVGRMIKSNALNKFITAANHGGTKLYTQEDFSVPNVTQVSVTGNDLPIEENVKRRVMFCELFLAGEVQDREFKREIEDETLAGIEFRGKCLSMLWAYVREWAVWRTLDREPSKRRMLKSFKPYCRCVGGVMEMLGWADPFQEAPGISGGDEEARDFKRLLTALADGMTTETWEFKTDDIVERARKMGVLEWLVGVKEDPPLAKKERIKWGFRLAKYRGRVFTRSDGNYFEFGKRDGEGGSIYPCRVAHDPKELISGPKG